jgi:hypothetical protein
MFHLSIFLSLLLIPDSDREKRVKRFIDYYLLYSVSHGIVGVPTSLRHMLANELNHDALIDGGLLRLFSHLLSEDRVYFENIGRHERDGHVIELKKTKKKTKNKHGTTL